MQVPPSDSQASSKDELEDERARLAAELADVKRKFLLVAKRKQQEYSKKVCMCRNLSAFASLACCTQSLTMQDSETTFNLHLYVNGPCCVCH